MTFRKTERPPTVPGFDLTRNGLPKEWCDMQSKRIISKCSLGADADVDPPSSPEEGVGPLLQRDYWAVIQDCKEDCAGVAKIVREKFRELAPESFVEFQHAAEPGVCLELGHELTVNIRPEQSAAVRVLHVDELTLTLGTLKGHPECGRITFGVYPNDRGDLVFHIRSRARTRSLLRYVGFLAVGDSMQACTWTEFIDRLAHTVGDGVVGAIQVETTVVEEEEEDRAMNSPTFNASEF